MIFLLWLFNIELDGFAGIADIIGRRYGSLKIPYNQHKSLAGSMSMLVFGFLVSIGCVTILSNSSFWLIDQLQSYSYLYGRIYELNLHVKWENILFQVDLIWRDAFDIIIIACRMLYYYSVLGHVQLDWASTLPRVAFISFVATLVESLPITKVVDDNISVPLATMAVAFFTFHH